MKWKNLKIDTIVKNSRVELENIKKFATTEEISLLINGVNNHYIKGDNERYCVYGLMTGSCFTVRAEELIKKCATNIKSVERLDSNLYITHKERRNSKVYFSLLEVLLFNNQVKAVDLIREVFNLESDN